MFCSQSDVDDGRATEEGHLDKHAAWHLALYLPSLPLGVQVPVEAPRDLAKVLNQLHPGYNATLHW